MSTVLRAQVRIPNASTLAQDMIVNTWHCRSTATDPITDAATFGDALQTLYEGFQEYMSPACGEPVHIDIYNLVDAEPRSPMGVGLDFNWTVSGTAMPNEVAVCLSYQAAGGSGISPGRRRGRIYLGPFNTTISQNGGFGATVSETFRGDAANLMEQFWDSMTGGSATFCVFSPTTAGSAPWTDTELLASSFPVVSGYIDNAFDTMRSRGIDASDRTIWPTA